MFICSVSCVALMEKLKHSEKETDKLNKQILELIKQKLDLAQQLEMWEVCWLSYTVDRENFVVKIINFVWDNVLGN